MTVVDNNPITPQCSDGVDNDGDGKVDFPDDHGCSSQNDNSENSENNGGSSAGTFKKLELTQLGLIEGEDYASTNCDVRDVDAAGLGLDSIGCIYEISGEKDVRLILSVRNPNSFEVDDVAYTVDLLDVGVRRSVGPIRFQRGQTQTRELALDIPHDVPTGNYDLRISVKNEEFDRTIYRTIHIQRPLDTPAATGQTVAVSFVEPAPRTASLATAKTCPTITEQDGLLDSVAKLLTCWLNKHFG